MHGMHAKTWFAWYAWYESYQLLAHRLALGLPRLVRVKPARKLPYVLLESKRDHAREVL
jgi:hypothetical protein